MQVFVPYSNDLSKSARVLDDLRLNKQLVEICQIICYQFNSKFGTKDIVNGHKNHPIVQYYNNIEGQKFLLYYAQELSNEYLFRYNKIHMSYFSINGFWHERWKSYIDREKDNGFHEMIKPVYIKGRKGKNQIITTKDVDKLYQDLLNEKWNNDIKIPKWTNRSIPEFYQKGL